VGRQGGILTPSVYLHKHTDLAQARESRDFKFADVPASKLTRYFVESDLLAHHVSLRWQHYKNTHFFSNKIVTVLILVHKATVLTA
jgi:hypothetical protein